MIGVQLYQNRIVHVNRWTYLDETSTFHRHNDPRRDKLACTVLISLQSSSIGGFKGRIKDFRELINEHDFVNESENHGVQHCLEYPDAQ